jgi:hypothetical protein
MDTNSSRRSFLKGSAVVGVAHIVRSPAFAASVQPSVIVVGAGAFGGWSALQLLQRGAKVTLIDAWGPETLVPAQVVRPAPFVRHMVLRTSCTRRWWLGLYSYGRSTSSGGM